MQYRVFDLETENHESYRRKASPFDPRNWVIAYGWADNSQPVVGHYYGEYTETTDSEWYIPDNIDILVGHNIKFDLLWVWDHPSTRAFIARGGKIWCTQIAEYMLGNMTRAVQWNTLTDVAPKYGGTAKFDPVKEMWEQGMLTSEIPEDILMEYLCGSERAGDGDVLNTEKIFLGQLVAAQESNQLHTIMNRMEALLSSVEMEYNGLKADKELGLEIAGGLQQELNEVNESLCTVLPELPSGFVFNWGSQYHVSALLFGGSLPYEKWVPHLDAEGNQLYAQKTTKEPLLDDEGNQLRFKSGKRAGELRTRNITIPDTTKPKGAKQEFLVELPGSITPLDEWEGKRTLRCGTPVYSTGADVIDHLVGHRLGGEVPAILRRRAKLDKDLGTYYIKYDVKDDTYKGMLTLVDSEGMLHGSLNHVATKTGRYSSKDPRQNWGL